MTTVATVEGPLELDRLGPTLMHEHVFVLSTEILQNYGEYWETEERIADAVTKLTALHERGIRTIVDPTVIPKNAVHAYSRRIQKRLILPYFSV